MRRYEKGEKVRLADESEATVLRVIDGQYEIEAGLSVGGGGNTRGGMALAGDVSYAVKNAKGKEVIVLDRDVRNPLGTITSGKNPEQYRKDKYRGEPGGKLKRLK